MLNVIAGVRSMGHHMNIGSLAKAADCQTVTIRFYERKGLLRAPARSGGNYRTYSQEDIARLTFIRNCRAIGLTLREIARLIAIQDNPALPCGEVNAYLDQHLIEVQQQKKALESLEQDLKRLRERCPAPTTSSGCGVLSELTRHRESPSTVTMEAEKPDKAASSGKQR